ncbi:MAG: SHOCT domain-containing protein [Rhodoluna sp.]|jgi:Short C-terminal domain|uniref:SHOCT domain-containing protein n=1 Tax=Aurantimicrobium minutum TaxID=708131 RepID=UPI002476ED67|nr:SHOCT domain-containing protein [Aurantimicrobium minutum]MDH6278635.1 putative membrane protein [Aurantimicrobium minutum]
MGDMSFLTMFIWAFVFIAYLMVLFSIVGDLFRDHKMSGWAKAAWIFFLIIGFWITALIYLIVRGGGMAQRQQAAMQEAQAQADAYIKQVAGNSHADEIAKAQALKDSGALTAAEFTALKKKILASK